MNVFQHKQVKPSGIYCKVINKPVYRHKHGSVSFIYARLNAGAVKEIFQVHLLNTYTLSISDNDGHPEEKIGVRVEPEEDDDIDSFFKGLSFTD